MLFFSYHIGIKEFFYFLNAIMRYTFLDLIEEILRKEKRAMSIPEIWDYAVKNQLHKKLAAYGKTPTNTMNACIRKHISSAQKVRFKQTSKTPALYFLNN